MAIAAEEGGASSIWVADHFFYDSDEGPRGLWEAMSILAALAEATQRVEVGPLVMVRAVPQPSPRRVDRQHD